MRCCYLPSIFLILAVSLAAPASFAQTVTESDFYDFGSASKAGHPTSSLIQASDGNFYGVALDVNYPATYGRVYRITLAGQYSDLYVFQDGADGANPESSLIQGPDGALYGTTSQGGGTYDSGTVFRLTLDGELRTIHQFDDGPNGNAPNTALTLGSDGNFYGVLSNGGVFKLSPSGEYTPLFDFDASNVDAFPYGYEPDAPPLEYEKEHFVGTTSEGGSCTYPGCGTVFTIDSGGGFQQIYSFPSPFGAVGPGGSMAIASNAAVYGTVANGPSGTDGQIFAISGTGAYVAKHNFNGATEGSEPAGVFLGSDGRLYSATFGGGANNTGTLVALTTSGQISLLHSFAAIGSSTDTDGAYQSASMVQASDGAFYGTSSGGGKYLLGVAYRLAFSPALPPPVSLTLSASSATAGEPIQLAWKVANAFSVSMQQCYAFVQGNAGGAGAWTGLQSGAIVGGAYHGSATLVPTATGTFTYALTCGGIESGFATLTVSGPAKATTSTYLQIGENSIPYDTSTQISAVVFGGEIYPTGSVVLSMNGMAFATVPLAAGTGTATLTVGPLDSAPGTYQLEATYEGDENYAPSASTALDVVMLPKSAATLTAVDIPGGEYPLNSTGYADVFVYSLLEDSTPTGTVTIYLDGKALGSTAIEMGGQLYQVNFSLQGIAAGTHTLYGQYSGDPNNAASTSASQFVYVAVQPNQVFLAASPITVSGTEEVTFSARVINQDDDEFPASGQVTFSTNGLEIGTASVNSSGIAKLTLPTSNAPRGAYPVTAEFEGNSSFGKSISPLLTITLQ